VRKLKWAQKFRSWPFGIVKVQLLAQKVKQSIGNEHWVCRMQFWTCLLGLAQVAKNLTLRQILKR